MSRASQELRDARYALSVLLSPLDANRALLDLYPEAAAMTDNQRRRMRHETTQSERVRMILRNDLSELAALRKMIVAVMVTHALNPEAPDTAIRAFAQLAKLGGWYAPSEVAKADKTVSVSAMLDDSGSVRAAIALFSHEPEGAIAMEPDE